MQADGNNTDGDDRLTALLDAITLENGIIIIEKQKLAKIFGAAVKANQMKIKFT